MKYSILLFDIDGTLLDFRYSEFMALKKLLSNKNININKHKYNLYHQIGQNLWAQFEKGELTKQQQLFNTFKLFFKKLNKKVDVKKAITEYRHFLKNSHSIIPMADAKKTLIFLKKQNKKLYIASNGITKVQHRRLEEAGLAKFFNQEFVSENLGFAKPNPKFFIKIAKEIPLFSKNKALMIGDSLSTDILGAYRFKIDSAWLNIDSQIDYSPIKPTYQLFSLFNLTKL